mgnify:CR=1 FL=1
MRIRVVFSYTILNIYLVALVLFFMHFTTMMSISHTVISPDNLLHSDLPWQSHTQWSPLTISYAVISYDK